MKTLLVWITIVTCYCLKSLLEMIVEMSKTPSTDSSIRVSLLILKTWCTQQWARLVPGWRTSAFEKFSEWWERHLAAKKIALRRLYCKVDSQQVLKDFQAHLKN
jgi:hypothetical protein